jgi:hypothetical protein
LSWHQVFRPIASQEYGLIQEKMMKLRHLASVAIAASAAAIGFAPIALADSTATTVQTNQGSAQIVAIPGPSAQNAARLQQPFGGNPSALLFHH